MSSPIVWDAPEGNIWLRADLADALVARGFVHRPWDLTMFLAHAIHQPNGEWSAAASWCDGAQWPTPFAARGPFGTMDEAQQWAIHACVEHAQRYVRAQ